ncbi:MAG: ABC transporter permease, partial [Desulfovibrionaceae bacterium]|nr:ABC transporter permease [Desulfovibrionaceae bacterium]
MGDLKFGARIRALIRKETRQMLRDRSTLTLGLILPMTLLLIFGFGLSLDVKQVPVAVVKDNSSSRTWDLFFKLKLSPYMEPRMVYSWQEAEELLMEAEIQAIVRRKLKDQEEREEIQIIVNGRDSNTARIMERYLEAAISQWLEEGREPNLGYAISVGRVFYNEAMESRWFLVPGVTVLIMTLIGSLLTALVVAREWERGTWEALAATPVQSFEILLGKTVPYFALGMVGLFLCLMAAKLVFAVPIRGSLLAIISSSAIYLLASLGMGLLISAQFKSQFLASQIVLIVSFMPTVMMSGFIFDLKSAPLIAQYLAHIFPATWYVELLQTLFLAGNVPEIL